MKSLLIKDLSVTAELDHASMAAVHGGYSKDMLQQWSHMPAAPKSGISFDASQMLGQTQDTVVNNGNNAAFVCGINATVNPSQTGTNNISFNR